MQLVAQEEERQRRQAQEQSSQTQAPVKTKMLRRLSHLTADRSPPKPAEGVAAKGNRKRRAGKKPKRPKEVGVRGRKGRGERTRSTMEEKADMDFVLLPLNDSGRSEGPNPAGDWSTSLSDARSPTGDRVLDEIGRQFLAVTKTPMGVKKSTPQSHGPKLKRLSAVDKGSVPRKKGSSPNKLTAPINHILDHSTESIPDLLPPLSSSRISQHDGNIVKQPLSSTAGVSLPENYDLLGTRSKTRLPILDSFPTSTSSSDALLEPMDVLSPPLTYPPPHVTQAPPLLPPPLITAAPHLPPTSHPSPSSFTPPPPPPPPGEDEVDEWIREQSDVTTLEGQNLQKSRTSQLLETMEEGEVETRCAWI